MPDIPLDTLFIVGLLLASFVGKLMEGRAKNNKRAPMSKPQSESDGRENSENKDLGDILRETFGEVIEPIPENSLPHVERENESIEYSYPKKAITKIQKPDSNTPVQAFASITGSDDDTKKYRSNRDWLRSEALSSKKSLRRAFLLKEVLDQPPGLRRSIF